MKKPHITGAAKAVALLATIWVACISARQSLADESVSDTCGWDELNHSKLVECNSCEYTPDSSRMKWPDFDQVLHIQSTRAGERFDSKILPVLDHRFDDHAKLFDINTTLRVSTNTKQEIIGLGATLDLASINQAEWRIYRPILADLFRSPDPSMTFLRLRIDADFSGNLTDWLVSLDNELRHVRSESDSRLPKIKIIIHPKPGFIGLSVLAAVLPQDNNSFVHLELWGFAFNSDALKMSLSPLSDASKALPKGCRLLVSVALREAPSLLETLDKNRITLQGLLVQSESSVAYDVLEHLASQKRDAPDFHLLAVARQRPQTKLHGDWSNAHEYAVEILNHLKHGATGFIEELTVADLRAKSGSTSADCSLYSLIETHKTHFRGPMYYAIGHFSRFLSQTRQLNYELFTQPNMFSAHYGAFMSKDGNYIIAMVLNGNEHHLPFSLNIDDWIVANTLIQPKSFNTFIKSRPFNLP